MVAHVYKTAQADDVPAVCAARCSPARTNTRARLPLLIQQNGRVGGLEDHNFRRRCIWRGRS